MPTRETTVKLTVADNFSAQLRAFATALDQSDKAVQKTSKQMGVFGQANQQLASGIKGGITMALASLPAVALAAAAATVKLGMDMEQTRVAFTTLTGSAELANQHLQDLRDFAKSTPFQFTELTDASKKMQAFGFATRDVIPMMTDIGDAVSALGAGSQGIDSVVRALGQMSAKGKVSAEEMNQLTEVGIKGWEYLARGMGKTTGEVMKLSERGLIPAGDAIQYILKGMREDFGGGMAAQSKTAAGQLSNLVDSLAEVATTIGEMAIPAITAIIGKLGEFANTLRDGVRAGELLINWNNRIRDAFTGTEAKIRASAKTYEEYKSATLATAEAAGLVNHAATTYGDTLNNGLDPSVRMLTEDQWNAAQGAYGLAGALDESTRAAQRSTAATEETAVKQMTLSEVSNSVVEQMAIMRETHDSLTEAKMRFNKAEGDAADAMAKAREEIAGQADDYLKLGESLKGATNAQLAQQAISNLSGSLESGLITVDQYNQSVRAIQLEYGLATEKSIAAGDALLTLNELYTNGSIDVDTYTTAIGKVNTAAEDGKVYLDELGISTSTATVDMDIFKVSLQEAATNHIPGVASEASKAGISLDAYSKATRNTETSTNAAAKETSKYREELRKLSEQILRMPTYNPGGGGAAAASPPARARGGPVIAGGVYTVGEDGPETLIMGKNGGGMVVPNTNNYNFNMTINTSNPASPIREFGLMQALAGAQ